MDINNIEFREFLLSHIKSLTRKEFIIRTGRYPVTRRWDGWDIVAGQWGIEFVNGWGMKNSMGYVTIQHYDTSNKAYSFTMKSCYYDDICQEFRQNKIDKILC